MHGPISKSDHSAGPPWSGAPVYVHMYFTPIDDHGLLVIKLTQ